MELKFSLVKYFISKQIFRLLYSQFNAIQIINTNQAETTVMALQSYDLNFLQLCGLLHCMAWDGEGQLQYDRVIHIRQSASVCINICFGFLCCSLYMTQWQCIFVEGLSTSFLKAENKQQCVLTRILWYDAWQLRD